MAFDPMLQRQIMGRFATGVTVVTTRYGEQISGMTANAVMSLSLDPPLIVVSVDRQSNMHGHLTQGQCYAINVLKQGQEDISRRFAKPGPKDFSDLKLTAAETGAPIFVDALAYMDCRVIEVAPAGDHDMFIGKPVAGETYDGQPLIFYSGQYAQLEAASIDS